MERAEAEVSARVREQVHAEQVGLLYKNAPLAYSTTLINGAILALVQSAHIPVSRLVVWYGSLLFVTAVRTFATWRYLRSNPRRRDARIWNLVYLAGAGMAGAVWGSAALLLFPLDSIAHQVFVAFVLAGMAAGGSSVLAARMEVCLAFLVPELLPLAFRYLTLDSAFQTSMGLLTLIFLAGMIISALNFHRVLRNSLYLRFDKQELEEEIALRRRAEEELFQEKDRLQATLSSIGEGVALVDVHGRIEYLNPAAEKLCGWSCYRALHRPAGEVFESIDRQNRRVTTALVDSLRSASQIRKQSILCGRGGKKRVIEELATPLHDRHSKAVGAVSVFRDMTEAQKQTEKLAYAAGHDPLTGLPNRNLLKDRAMQAIARAQRKDESFALLFLDLDGFKEVNDRMGHASGDALLLDVARRLASCVREEDTIARLGGDEFVVLLEGPTQDEQIKAVAEKILRTLREPYQLGKESTRISVSIGSSRYPGDGQDTESLLMHADSAMYRAKQQGRDRMCVG
jgi:diguanylate cyclase (GGDEF)-like protein/PAS domain S-box-containing protein